MGLIYPLIFIALFIDIYLTYKVITSIIDKKRYSLGWFAPLFCVFVVGPIGFYIFLFYQGNNDQCSYNRAGGVIWGNDERCLEDSGYKKIGLCNVERNVKTILYENEGYYYKIDITTNGSSGNPIIIDRETAKKECVIDSYGYGHK